MKNFIVKRNLNITLIVITITSVLLIYYFLSQNLLKEETSKPNVLLKKIPPKQLPVTFDFDGPSYPNPSLSFSGKLPSMPEEMIVYKVIQPNITEEYVREIGEKMIGNSKNAELRRSSRLGLFFLNSPDWSLEVDPANGTITLRKIAVDSSDSGVEKRSYPSTEQCKTIANEFLKRHKLLSDDLYVRGVVDNTKSSFGVMSVGYNRKIDGYNTWGAGSGISVHINANGEVVRFSKHWQEIEPYGTCEIKKPEDALKELLNGKGVLMNGDSGKIISIELRYYSSPQQQQYLQPIYYFKCTRDDGDFYGIIPAIKDK